LHSFLWVVSFVCFTGVVSGTGLMVQAPVVASARADVVSSSTLCLTVADVRSMFTMRAGGSHVLDLAAFPRFGTIGGEGRWIGAGLGVLRRRPEILRNSSRKGIDLCNVTCSRGFVVKSQGYTVLYT
jgi:hypothetical protein